jgi:ribosome maturation factor RimP
VAGEEVVMNGSSRRNEARPERHRALARPEDLTALLEPVVTEAGLELESVRVSRAGSRRILRVVVDGEHGVDMDDIARVSRAVAAEIDDSDAMGSGGYTLEVSSPGVDRPLTEPKHWRRAAGRLVRVSVKNYSCRTADATSAPANGDRPANPKDSAVKNSAVKDSAVEDSAVKDSAVKDSAVNDTSIEGRVIAAGPDSVTLEIDGERRELGYADLGPGQVQVEFGGRYGDLGGSASGGDDPAVDEPAGHEGEHDGH